MGIKTFNLILLYAIMSTISLLADNGTNPRKAVDLEQFVLERNELPEGFVIYYKEIMKIEDSTQSVITKRWRRTSDTMDLVLVLDTCIVADKKLPSYLKQIWKQKDIEKKGKGKIVTELFLFHSAVELQDRMSYYKIAYSVRPDTAGNIRIGDKTWVWVNQPLGDSYSILFTNNYFLVRIYATISGLTHQEVKDYVINLAQEVNNKIMNK
jgi:hypothetical protein